MDRVISVEYALRDDDEKGERGNGYSPDRRGRERSPGRRRSPSPYGRGRERGSPDYGRSKERGSPDYGRGGRSPDNGRGVSPAGGGRGDHARGGGRSPDYDRQRREASPPGYDRSPRLAVPSGVISNICTLWYLVMHQCVMTCLHCVAAHLGGRRESRSSVPFHACVQASDECASW
jgi:hypothetical protein